MRVAVLTPPGRGALAVAAVNGPGAEAFVARVFRPRGSPELAERPDGAIVFGRWEASGDGPGEELLVIRRGRDDLEIHCHGGLAAVEAVVASLERQGATRHDWTAWLRQRGCAEIEIEARESLSRVCGPKAARILVRQLAGGLEAEFDAIERLLAVGQTAEARPTIERLLRAAQVGRRLTRPWRVVLAGRVNAGKSSLFNAIAGHARSIVSAEPGTTRDLVETRIVLAGWEVDLVDTGGFRDDLPASTAVTSVERAGMDRATAACEAANLVVHVVDPWERPELDRVRPAPPGGRDEILAFTKADLCTGSRPIIVGRPVWTSGLTGEGVEELVTRIVRMLVPEEADEPELLAGSVPFTDRQVDLLAGWLARCRVSGTA
ncbi:MAG: GTPase [Planctomycetia bacterium]